MKQTKEYLYGISKNTQQLGFNLHFGRSVVCFYHLTKFKFRVVKYSGFDYATYETIESRPFFGLQIYKEIDIKTD
jgi:hypothetical protein